MNPTVSVVIPTKNRREILAQTIASILKQNISLEIIVLDDGGNDGTPAMLRAQFPDVRVERFEQSKGPTLRRNQGAKLARGEFLFTIDDDCTFPDADTFAQTVAAFDKPQIGAVTVPFTNVNKDATQIITAAPDDAQPYAAFDYYGGMIAFRRKLFTRLGGYRPYYFMNVEEGDLAMRMLNAGYVVRLGTAAPLDHHESPIRVSKRLNELGPRNSILYAWYNVPMPFLVPHIIGTGLKAALHIWRIGHPDQAVRGYLQGWAAVLHEMRKRRPVSRACYQLSRELVTRRAVPMNEVLPRLAALEGAN